MKLLLVVDTFFLDRPSGSARVAYDIACLMRDRGASVTCFCRRQKPDDSDLSTHDGIEVVRFDFPRTASLDPLKLHKQIAAGTKAARRYLTGRTWDTVHLHQSPHGRMVINALGPEQNYVFTAHSPMVDEELANWADQGAAGKIKSLLGKGLLRRVEYPVLQQVRRIHTLSNYTRQTLMRQYDLQDKFTVIPHWCRPDFVRQLDKAAARVELGWSPAERVIFTVRRLAPRMGLDTAIEALAPLLRRYPDVRFCIAGQGSLRAQLMAQAESLSVTERVVFLGRVSDDVLRQCYEAADLFILPTRALECFGLPVLEALAYGLPLISTDAAAIPELMRPILPDCIVPAGDADALSSKIDDFLGGRLTIPSSDQLVRYAMTHYGVETIGEKIAQFLTPSI